MIYIAYPGADMERDKHSIWHSQGVSERPFYLYFMPLDYGTWKRQSNPHTTAPPYEESVMENEYVREVIRSIPHLQQYKAGY